MIDTGIEEEMHVIKVVVIELLHGLEVGPILQPPIFEDAVRAVPIPRRGSEGGLEPFQAEVLGITSEVHLCHLERHRDGNGRRLEREDPVSGEVLDDEGEELRVAIRVEDASRCFLKVVLKESRREVVGRVKFDLTARELEFDTASDDGEEFGRLHWHDRGIWSRRE